ncbi:sacsin N-terminal ATP-binding-like domain-containing protein [uncultured Cohaesibacter sp.]|uniref:sacsin N-terminal ATP-binding-like domain-containing protein n=1 Tax=uncultured Cohaesibacter sp. TaxID=1002546 RepID=UPI002AA8103E|nr:hypothetical protein [uncultured Cohaesibacter sp.]
MSVAHTASETNATDKSAVIAHVRSEREDLARVLKKHTGIRRIVEELYPDSAHFIFELLQNAEDTGATEVDFVLTSDCLAFEHNGRPFTEADILGITDVGEGTKSDDEDKIGRFGVGFKAVFAYTDSPRIWSQTFSFQIDELVLPTLLDDRTDLGERTRFEFPFNNAKKPTEPAYKEVEDGLRDLAETTLLFLNNMQSISWKIGDDVHGAVLRIQHAENHIEVLKETNGATTSSSHFLRFARSVEGLNRPTQHKVAAAFALEFLPDVKGFQSDVPIAKQLKIAPVQGQVAVFFPADKETSGLRFNLHALFVPELSRASIKETPANEPLFKQLAALCAAAMHDIKGLGLLSRDFLGVLPNPQDTLGSRYEKIREAIIAAFNDEPLMPTFARDHAPAKYLYQAKNALKELLSADDIEFLIEYDDEPPQWAANQALQGTNSERFMSGLAIHDWDVENFLETAAGSATEDWRGQVDEEFMAWISAKPVDWLQRMYAMFARDPETEDELGQLSDARIIRLSGGTLSKADECYFPDEQRRYLDIVPCVDPALLEAGNSGVVKKAARKFLEEIGVKEVGERQLVEALLDKEYQTDNRTLHPKNYAAHLRRFMKLANDDTSAVRMLQGYHLFLGADGHWHPAKDIFLDRPHLDTGMSEYYDIVGLPKGVTALAEFYRDLPLDVPKVVRFIESLGARKQIPVRTVSCQSNPEWERLRNVPGERYTSPSDVDYRIESFDKLTKARSVRISRLIWNTLVERGNDDTWRGVLQAAYRKNWSGGTRYAHSQLVHQLRRAEWIPQGDRFVRPAAARAELLPDGFTFDPGWVWIKQIDFGKDVELENEKAKAAAAEALAKRGQRQAAAAALGLKLDDLVWLQKVSEVPPEERERFLEEWERSRQVVELPDHEPRNPDRRAERVGALAADAPERKTEERTRSVSVGREDVKAEAGQYLQQQYSSDGDVICQVCKKPMPFKLDDGAAYFERVEFLPELKKWHHQNYLALCPNHAAMFRHANSTRDMMQDMFIDLMGNELDVVLAQTDHTIYFTKTHIADLKKVIEIDDAGEPEDVAEQAPRVGGAGR